VSVYGQKEMANSKWSVHVLDSADSKLALTLIYIFYVLSEVHQQWQWL